MLLIQNLSFNNFHQMESAISLRYCPFPYSSKGFQGAGSIRFHLRFNHATPLCAPQFSTTRHPVTRSVGHANCILGRFSRPSQNDGRGSKIFRGVTGASLVLACVLGLFNFKMNPKLTTAHAFDPFSISDSSTFNPSDVDDHGKVALKSLLKIMNDAEEAPHQNKSIPSQFNKFGPSKDQVHTLKSIAIGQSKSDMGRQALKTLEQQYKYCEDNNYQEAEQYLIVALVDVYISQEKLEEASKMLDKPIDQLLHTYSKIFYCKKCNDCKKGKECNNKKTELSPKEKCDEILKLYESDDNEIKPNKQWIAELILYKAIVHTMLEYKDAGKRIKGNKQALQWRKAFNQTF